MTWQTGRPIFGRLPAKGYQDNPTVDTLTQWADSELMAVKGLLESFGDRLDPDLAPADGLNYLAYLVGMSGPYWDNSWPVPVKRAMIANAFTFWRNKGTLGNLRAVLDLHGFSYQLWTDGDLRMPFAIPGIMKSNKLRVYVRLPLTYTRVSTQWRESERSVANWLPAGILSGVSYQTFAMGYSVLGDPMFL